MTAAKAAPLPAPSRALMTGVSYATSAELAGELGPFPEYAANEEAMLRVIRNHRRAAHGETDGYEKLATAPVPLDLAAMPEKDLVAAAASAPGTTRWRWARSSASATPRPPSSRPPAPSGW